MERLKEFLEWHLQNPHNVNFKMIVAKEDREETLKAMHEISALMDTGLDPEQIRELKERNTPKKVRYQNRHGEGYDYKNEDYYHCPSCGRRLRNKKHDPVCPRCAQLLDWRIDNARDTIQSKADR